MQLCFRPIRVDSTPTLLLLFSAVLTLVSVECSDASRTGLRTG